MTYAIASALQAAVYTCLSADTTVQSLVGSNVFDALPSGILPSTFIVIGEEDARAKSDVTAAGAVHILTVSILSDAAGFAAAKAVAVATSDALADAALTLSRGHLVSLDFVDAKARRGKAPDGRRIDMRFRARVEDI